MTLTETTIHIADDFDLQKIADSGQCFRARRMPDGSMRFVTGEQVIYLRALGGDAFAVRCAPGAWETVWTRYFDLARDYRALRSRYAPQGGVLRDALGDGAGLRVLRQDAWEMLITFILSQRKRIPAIAASVEALATRCGTPVQTDCETLHLFPTPQAVCALTDAELSACAMGYRAPYVRAAAEQVANGALDLAALDALPDDALRERLLQVRGVGIKVANCVCLYGYGRTACAPVDVWVRRAIDAHFGGVDPFAAFGEDAGLLQQYLFYHQRGQMGVA